ncbi:MAG: serine hydrolase domain-containing protein [Armatimonas sp.]
MNRIFLAIGALLLLSSLAQADSVDSYIRMRQERDHVPGIAVAIVKDGKVVRKKGYGYADLEHKARVTTDTPYQLASVTKQFTATAIMMLVEEGKLKLEDRVSQHLTDLPAAWSEVTIRQLLNHTSGIKSYTSVPDFGKMMRTDFSHQEILGLVAKEPLEFASGSAWNYNNTGYFLLGMLLEKVSGKLYGDFLTERIFKPLGMSRTRVNNLQIVIPGRARGYTWDGSTVRNGEYVSPTQPYAAGALISTIDDMIKWADALESRRLLTQASWDQIWTATRLTTGKTENYGFGWSVNELNGHRMVEHSGGIPGFATDIVRFPEDRVTVIVLCNSDQINAASLATGIARHYIPTLAPTPPKTISVTPEAVQGISGYYDWRGSIGVLLPRSGQISLNGDLLSFSALDTFFLNNFDRSPRIQTFRVVKDRAGQPTEIVQNEERHIARIGPLASLVALQPDSDSALNQRINSTMKALSQGEKTLENFPVAPGFKARFAGVAVPELSGYQNLSYLATYDISARNIERHGGKVSRVLYYRLAATGPAKYLLVYLTADGLITDIDAVTE